jgi:excisionase family DNA binding protein
MKHFQELPDVLSVKEVMTFLGISRGKTYELVNSGELHSVRIGARILVPKLSLQALLGHK